MKDTKSLEETKRAKEITLLTKIEIPIIPIFINNHAVTIPELQLDTKRMNDEQKELRNRFFAPILKKEKKQKLLNNVINLRFVDNYITNI